MGPRAREAGQGIFHAGQRDLQHGFAGLRAVGENLQNDFLSVDDGEAGFLFPVALLGRGEFLVEHDDVGFLFLGQGDEFGGFARADEKFRLLVLAQVDEDGAGDGDLEVFDELLQFSQQFLAFAGFHVRGLDAHQQGTGYGFLFCDEISHEPVNVAVWQGESTGR